MGQPWYHELFPGGYKVNPRDLVNSVSLTRLLHHNRLKHHSKEFNLVSSHDSFKASTNPVILYKLQSLIYSIYAGPRHQ